MVTITDKRAWMPKLGGAAGEGCWTVGTALHMGTVLCAKECNKSIKLDATAESRPEVGSSMRRTNGVESNSQPMLHRLRSPPEVTERREC